MAVIVWGKPEDMNEFQIKYKEQGTNTFDPRTYLPLPTSGENLAAFVNGNLLQCLNKASEGDRELIKNFLQRLIAREWDGGERIRMVSCGELTIIHARDYTAVVRGSFLKDVLGALEKDNIVCGIEYKCLFGGKGEIIDIYNVRGRTHQIIYELLKGYPHVCENKPWGITYSHLPKNQEKHPSIIQN